MKKYTIKYFKNNVDLKRTETTILAKNKKMALDIAKGIVKSSK